jgi:mono/diheme cytochrome c family protein
MRDRLSWICAASALLLTAAAGAAQRETSMKSTPASDEARGQKIYEKSCAICHFASSAEKKIGPGLKGEMKRETFANGWKVNDENLRRWIESGGKNMPSSPLNREQIREVIAYVKTL